MKIINIDHSLYLNNFIVQQGQSNFLQSWEWGEFQKAQGKSIYHLGIEDKGNLVAFALVIKQKLPLGKCYLYCPRGPLVANFQFPISPPALLRNAKRAGNFQKKIWDIFLFRVKEIAKEERAIFCRFDFPYPKLPDFLLSQLVKSPLNGQPQNTLVLDIEKPEEGILAQMKPKWRYNIRLAARKGVKVRQGVNLRDLACFLGLLKETAKRNNFRPHPEDYYQKMLEILGAKGLLKIFLAEYQGKALAVNLVLFWGKRATYLHGASAGEYRNLMASHLLQWEQILEAKRRGCTEYDFWGISKKVQSMPRTKAELLVRGSKFPKAIPRYRSGCYGAGKVQSWEGITRFKKGFGGREVYYAGTYDLILNNFWYKIYRFFR